MLSYKESQRISITLNVFVRAPVSSCSHSSKTRGEVGCCGVGALARLFPVQTVHAKVGTNEKHIVITCQPYLIWIDTPFLKKFYVPVLFANLPHSLIVWIYGLVAVSLCWIHTIHGFPWKKKDILFCAVVIYP